ncbi:multiple sugar transport system permease protein [Sporosarcina luteola]|nr:multiple sugar transport system permease protein [Sporosarcina luteola]
MERTTWRASIQAYLYLLPALVIIVLFTIYPIIKSLLISFYDDYDYFNDIVYARGFASYQYLWNDPTFHKALWNTFVFVIGVVPASIALSMFIAVLLNSNIRLRSFFRTAYFIPFVTSVVAVSIVWRWIFHTEYGLFNYVLGLFGADPVAWLTDPKWAMPSLIILSIWKGLGYNIIIFLAGLQNINEQYNLAARMDGAGKAKRFFHITLPLLSPTTFFVSIVSIIGSFKVFDEIYALFGGQPGPASSALTVVYYIFEKFYSEWEFGIASAAAYCLFIIIFILTLIQLYIGKRKVTY